ncbi:MAG: radical SAM family heme chaperone HemW [Spirochaetaceae bacterium]|jgi:oxygen-independent coproporphyrinogen-3 oxidase|nr:radical SAM family heme chaperone HemW [Spirochaetaceae bacterium]
MTASLYIHIPFCKKKCDYCDFYSIPIDADSKEIDVYIDTLCSSIKYQFECHNVDKVPTVYIGGGTPSFIKSSRIEKLLSFLESILPSLPEEFTVEANPESLTEAFIAAVAGAPSCGITRLSIGVQTFSGRSRKAVGRLGKTGDIKEKLKLVSASGIDFSVDIISGLPYQHIKTLMNDIELSLLYKPSHISLYDLSLEKGSLIAEEVKKKKRKFPNAETAESLWILGRDMLESAGYDQYEVSNFALNGKRSLHNIRYWRMLNWIGCGISASSTLINDDMCEGIRCVDGSMERLDKITLLKETLMMGFRFIDGPDEALFKKRFLHDIEYFIPHTVSAWRKNGLLCTEKTALTKEGLLLLNRFIYECFLEIDFRNN